MGFILGAELKVMAVFADSLSKVHTLIQTSTHSMTDVGKLRLVGHIWPTWLLNRASETVSPSPSGSLIKNDIFFDIAGNDQIRLCKSALVKIKKIYIFIKAQIWSGGHRSQTCN